MRDFQTGDTIKYTGAFLKSSGLTRGLAPLMRFKVRACDCALCQGGSYVAVNSQTVFFDPAADPDSARWLHIHKDNVYRVGTSHKGNAL